ncbi:MAG: hypothetical protein LBE80_11225 [Deltaproteobacteria bacterium]|nr:hypothetical protein [Deltaproteobacteria bacterium]
MSEVKPTDGLANLSALPGASGSIQLRFAVLQMELAKTNKEKAMTVLTTIQNEQEKTKQVADYIKDARDRKVKAPINYYKHFTMPDDMHKFFSDNGLKVSYKYPDDKHYNESQWEYNIKSLENYMETLGTDTQQNMVYVQDFMGQYNSYLSGANSAIQKSADTLAALARLA